MQEQALPAKANSRSKLDVAGIDALYKVCNISRSLFESSLYRRVRFDISRYRRPSLVDASQFAMTLQRHASSIRCLQLDSSDEHPMADPEDAEIIAKVLYVLDDLRNLREIELVYL